MKVNNFILFSIAFVSLSILIEILLLSHSFYQETFIKPSPIKQEQTSTSTPSSQPQLSAKQYQYIEVTDGCGPYFEGVCANLRSGPGTEFPVLNKLRNHIVLKVADTVTNSKGETWYKIDTSEYVLYPERIHGDWYISSSVVNLFYDKGDILLQKGEKVTTHKKIVVSLSQQKLYAYDGNTLFMEAPVSTGLTDTPTSLGKYTVFKMTPSRYMQGPVPGVSDQYYDLPGVPWDLYFTSGGAVIHGAYWHDHFGTQWSHGCVNLSPNDAKKLYYWADIGMPVTVQQ